MEASLEAGMERYRSVTSGSRALPGFVIVGGQRCGTTSLYRRLIEHPAIGAATTKEVHFFDVNFERGVDWYRAHFPTRAHLEAIGRRTGLGAMTGEASPYYLFHPRAPYRLADILPGVRLIVMLREPVSRMISHYHHEVALGHEDRPFERAVELEQERLAGEEERILREPTYRSYAHQHHSYFARGLYADQLERWLSVVPRDRVLIVESRRFFEDTTVELDRVMGFLGFPPQHRMAIEVHDTRFHAPMDEGLMVELHERYVPHNQRLYSLLDEDFGWKMWS
jgi:Sulfotransferase domain